MAISDRIIGILDGCQKDAASNPFGAMRLCEISWAMDNDVSDREAESEIDRCLTGLVLDKKVGFDGRYYWPLSGNHG